MIDLMIEPFMYGGFNPTYLLNNYGKPEKVFLSSGLLIMFYEKEHILAKYGIDSDPETKQACFAFFNDLYTWASEDDRKVEDIKGILGVRELIEWEDATGQSIQDFYQAFVVWKGGENCFQYAP